jgi:hypothetical protein
VSDRLPRHLSLELPPLTPAQADAVLQALAALQEALWAAYQDELLDAAVAATAAAQETSEQDAQDDEEAFWDQSLSS